ncbi:MAG TPA: LamG domain-containing protein [Polyangiaceae bacterium]|nr:LamG domain-containing protein [Polyangiaceae bacterium]
MPARAARLAGAAGLALALAGCGEATTAPPEELTDSGPVDASYDGALSFDGVDDYASVGTARMPKIEREQSLMLLFRAEVKVSGGPDVQALFALRRGGRSGIVLALDGDVPLVYNVFGARDLARASAKVSLRTWHQMAYVVQGDSSTLYIDGAVAATGAGPTTNRTPIEGMIGSVDGYAQMFHGAIDELRVYDRAFSLEEIDAVDAGMAPADAEQLVLYLPFNEASGARSYDRSGLDNHAELGDGVPELMPTRIRAAR